MGVGSGVRGGGTAALSQGGGATFDPAGGGDKKTCQGGGDRGGEHGQKSYQISEKGQNFEFCRESGDSIILSDQYSYRN